MENLYLKRERNSKSVFATPEVNFQANIGVCEISGESCLENTVSFYDQLLKWLRQYQNEVKKGLEFNFKLTYFNTSSSKSILELLIQLSEMTNVTINWFYDPDNKIAMQQEKEDFEDEAEVKMNFLPLTKKFE